MKLKYLCLFIFLNAFSEIDINKLSTTQKIEQLLMVAAPSKPDKKVLECMEHFYKKHSPGATIFLQRLTHIKDLIETEKLIDSWIHTQTLYAGDYEYGLRQKLLDGFRFPRYYILGNADKKIIEEVAFEIGTHCKNIGVLLDLAPTVDVNTNPNNPIIGTRSFGSDYNNVSECAIAFLKGLKNSGVFSCIKHFPGHGDTHTDSHTNLPIIEKSLEELLKTDLKPFIKSIESGFVDMVLVSHILNPAIDKKSPASLSKAWYSILRNNLNFNGIAITDSLSMKAVSHHKAQHELALNALIAGADMVILDREDDDWINFYTRIVPKTIKNIKFGIKKGLISLDDINEKCKKILELKNKAQKKAICDIDLLNANKLFKKVYADVIKIEKGVLKKFKNPKKYIVITKDNFKNIDISKLKNTLIYIEFYANKERFVLALNDNEYDHEFLDFINNDLKKFENNTLVCAFVNKELYKKINLKNKILCFEYNEASKEALKSCLNINF